MKARIVGFPRFDSLIKKRRTILHSLDFPCEVGDVIITCNVNIPTQFGPFLRVVAVEVGLLSDFLKRPGEAKCLDTTMETYVASWKKNFHVGTKMQTRRIEFEYMPLPTENPEAITAISNALPAIEAIKFLEDVHVIRCIDAAIKTLALPA